MKLVPPSCQYLVRIRLMPDIPYQPVTWRVEHIMQRNCQFDDAQTCTQVTTGHRHGADRFSPQFVCHLPKLLFFQAAQIGRNLDRV